MKQLGKSKKVKIMAVTYIEIARCDQSDFLRLDMYFIAADGFLFAP